MIERLREYTYGDPRPRQLRDRLSLLVAFTWAIVGFALEITTPRLIWQSVGVLVVLQTLTTLQFCMANKVHRRSIVEQYRVRITGVSLAAMVVALTFGRPHIRAAVIAEKLRSLDAARHPTEPEKFQEARQLISEATSEGIILPPSPVEAIVATRLAQEDVGKIQKDRLDQKFVARGIPLPVPGIIIRKVNDVGVLTIKGISGEGVNSRNV